MDCKSLDFYCYYREKIVPKLQIQVRKLALESREKDKRIAELNKDNAFLNEALTEATDDRGYWVALWEKARTDVFMLQERIAELEAALQLIANGQSTGPVVGPMQSYQMRNLAKLALARKES